MAYQVTNQKKIRRSNETLSIHSTISRKKIIQECVTRHSSTDRVTDKQQPELWLACKFTMVA
jgi:hypothetical protein